MTPTSAFAPSVRRRCAGAALSLALLTGTAAFVAPAASAAPSGSACSGTATHRSAFPTEVALPVGFRPEGITSGPGTTFYVGSLADGRIYRGDLRTGEGSVLLEGVTGRQLRGMQYDARTGLLWVVGNDPVGAKVWAVDARTGAVVYEVVVPGAVFLNDLVITRTAVWVTDSRVDRLTRIDLTSSGRPAGTAPAFVDITGDWPTPSGLRANGIRELPGGDLILDNSTAGGLYAVDPVTGVSTAIPVSGGPGIIGGDGLELRGNTLYVVRGSGQAEVSVLRLRRADGGWLATWQGALTSPGLSIPSTATLAAGALYAVNARFGVVPNASTASYSVTRLPLRPCR
jgi:hypothetical protein